MPNFPTFAPPAPPGASTVTPSPLQVRVYPNPWRSDKHASGRMTFDCPTVGTI
jgi:hypothetical protein